MSVFSMIKRGRQAAKDHQAEKAKKDKEEAAKPPYKHVPRHAAIDALSGGPAGWRENDRRRIVEQNRRRSAMTVSGIGMSGASTPVHPGLPRVHSALSHVSYPAAYASPVVHLPRNYSYSSVPPGWTPHHGREMSYSPVDMGLPTLKGKEVDRILDSSRTSRSSSKMSTGRIPLPPMGPFFDNGDAAQSPAESSGNSTSSQDDLEMKPVVRHSAPVPAPTSAAAAAVRTSRPTSDTDYFHRLHPARSRRVSDPNQSPGGGSSRTSPLAPRTSSLTPGIPPVPALPAMQFGTAITTPEVFSSAASSAASSVTMVPVASSASLATKGAAAVSTPVMLKSPEHVVGAPQQAEILTATESSSGEEEAPVVVAAAVAAQFIIGGSPGKKSRRISKMTRFTELQPIKSNTTTVTVEPVVVAEPSPTEEESPREEPQDKKKKSKKSKDDSSKKRPTSTATALPTSFDEAALSTTPTAEIVLPPATTATTKSGKLSKGAAPPSASGKLVKKNRWSLRSSKSTAVAV